MDDEIEQGILANIETLAKNSIVAHSILVMFYVLSSPFVMFGRTIILIVSLGNVKPSFSASYNNGAIMFIAGVSFIFCLGYFHLIIGPHLYGNLS